MTKPLDRLSDFALAGAGLVAELVGRMFDRIFDRFVNGIAGLALAIGASACGSSDVAPAIPSPPVPHEVAAAPKADPVPEGPRTVGEFSITFYYVIGEDEVVAKPVAVAANDNRAGSDTPESDVADTQLASIAEPERVTIYDGGGTCQPISEVTKAFAAELALQGTGKLHDGRVVNIWGACNCGHSPCFKVTPAQWGTAGSGRALQPFRTVAVDPKVVKLGSLLYVPLLEGRLMPGRPPWGGFVHDGCVIADDTGGHIDGQRLDLFVGRKAYFLGLSGSGGSHAWARHVPVYDGSGICERKGRQVGRRAASI